MRRLRKLVCDGLKGFPEAIEAVFPQAAVQTCIVHLIRSNSLDFVSWKDRKPVVAELRKIYRAADAEAGREICAGVLHVMRASDLVTKRGVSAAIAARHPIRSLPD